MNITKLSSREARTNWRDVLDTIDNGTADVVIERYGKPIATLIPYKDYEALLDELEDLRDGRLAQAAYEAYLQAPTTAQPYQEVRGELLAEGIWDEE